MSALNKLDKLGDIADLVRALDLAVIGLSASGGAGPDEHAAVRELVRAVEVRLAELGKGLAGERKGEVSP